MSRRMKFPQHACTDGRTENGQLTGQPAQTWSISLVPLQGTQYGYPAASSGRDLHGMWDMGVLHGVFLALPSLCMPVDTEQVPQEATMLTPEQFCLHLG